MTFCRNIITYCCIFAAVLPYAPSLVHITPVFLPFMSGQGAWRKDMGKG